MDIEKLTLDFDSLDSMCAAASSWDWGLDFVQLDRGVCTSRFQRVAGEHTSLLRLEVGRRILQRGEAPRGLITFGIAVNCIGDMSWNIRDIDNAMLLEFATGNEFEGISSPGFICYTMNFSPEKLAQLADQYGIRVSVECMGVIDRITPVPHKIAGDIVRLMDYAVECFPTGSNELQDIVEEAIPLSLLRALEKIQTGSRIKPSTKNIAGFKRARDFLESKAGEHLVIADLCGVSGLNMRTLQRCFRRYLDLTPRDYQRIIRLKRARTELLARSSLDTVSEIAMRNGFNHLGRFSAQYREQFGELPRQTSKRSYSTGSIRTGAAPKLQT